jgi:hypothetical protein
MPRSKRIITYVGIVLQGYAFPAPLFNQERTAQNPFEVLTRLTLTYSFGTRSYVVEPD